MVKRLLMPMLAAVIIVAMVIPGCGEPAPTEYTLTVSSTLGGSVTTPGEGAFGPYDAATVVNLVAEANEGWLFSKWLGSVATIANVNAAVTTITMNGNYVIVAEFTPDVGPAPAGWAPVELKLLIRTEDERLGMGDYFGDLMELQRFKTDRLYRSGSEAAPIWQNVPPALAGAWQMYTGGWVSTLVSRDESADFFWFYCGVWGWGPYAVQEPDPAFYDVCEKLDNVDLDYMGETGLAARELLMEAALFGASADSSTVHTVTVKGFNPWHKSVNVAPDLSAGVYGSRYWGYTIHTRNDVTGDVQLPTGSTKIKIAMPSIVTNPWNPVDGSNWVYDMMPIRAAGDAALLPHPVTGFWLPQRIQSASIDVQEDLPMLDPDPTYTASYLTVTRVPTIAVPDTAWVDWDVTTKQFITAAQKRALDPTWDALRGTALRKSIVVYENDIYANKWHDGSDLSLADFVMMMIYPFERGRDGGLFYDPQRYAGTFGSFFYNFRGVEIIHDGYTPGQPLTIATYSNAWTLDPDWSLTTWFPFYAQGSAAWHNLGIGIMAVADNAGAFSSRRAGVIGKPWLNYVYGDLATGGPPLLDTYLQAAILTPTGLPYYSLFNGLYAGFAAEATARLANLNAWYVLYGNFWQGTGPYMIANVDKGLNQVKMLDNPYFKDSGGKWLAFCTADTVGTVPAHTGAWIDEINFSQVPQALAMFELNPGNINVYAFSISDGELFFDILPGLPNIRYAISFGSWSELLFNPVPVFDDGRVNPLGDAQLREAIQWLIDRDTIADEIYGGMAAPKYSLLTDVFPEATERYPLIMAALRDEYASQPAKGAQIISDRMEVLGFVLYFSIADGKALWHYEVPTP